jgi:hypothetical protein
MIDYLVTLFNAAGTLGAATPQVTIYDGPAVSELDPQLKLYVGMANPDNPGEVAYDSTQTWAAIGRFGRDEQLTIHCCSEAWSGDDNVQTVRRACTAITSAVEVLMQADSSQFGGNVLFPDPGMSNVASPQNSDTGKGVIVRQSFDLIFRCRIGGF